mgnify:CR=1 FL=1
MLNDIDRHDEAELHLTGDEIERNVPRHWYHALAAAGLVAAVGTAVVYYVGGHLAIVGTISIGTVGAFVIYVGQIYQPLTQLTNARVDVMTALVSFERVFEILDFPSIITEASDATDLERIEGRIDLDHVSFRHPAPDLVSLASLEDGVTPSSDPSEWILRDIDLHVAPGEFVALVGPSGAGKTTTAMLVPRIADAVEGAVRIDGHAVRGQKDLAQHLALVWVLVRLT